MSETKHTFTILKDGEEVVSRDAYTLVGGFILNEYKSPYKALDPVSLGRGSVGDQLTLLVATIKNAKSIMKNGGATQEVIEKMVFQAMKKGLQ